MATDDGYDTHEGNAEKMDEPRWNLLLAMCSGLWLGLGLITVFFLGWLVGVAIVALGLGSTLILIDIASNRSRDQDEQ